MNYLHAFQPVVIHHFDGDDMQSRFEFRRLPVFPVEHDTGFEALFGMVFKIPAVKLNTRFARADGDKRYFANAMFFPKLYEN